MRRPYNVPYATAGVARHHGRLKYRDAPGMTRSIRAALRDPVPSAPVGRPPRPRRHRLGEAISVLRLAGIPDIATG